MSYWDNHISMSYWDERTSLCRSPIFAIFITQSVVGTTVISPREAARQGLVDTILQMGFPFLRYLRRTLLYDSSHYPTNPEGLESKASVHSGFFVASLQANGTIIGHILLVWLNGMQPADWILVSSAFAMSRSDCKLA